MKKTILVIIIAAWLLIPTGTPDDLVTWWLIGAVGKQVYLLSLALVLFLLWYHKITLSKITKTIGGLFK